MLALSPQDSPDTALGVVSRIRSIHGDKTADFPELTTSLAVVYDAFADMSGEASVSPDPNKAARLFAYYTNARGQMRFDPKELPWQLAIFVVDCQVRETDLPWALGRYGGRQKLRDLFFDVQYNEAARYTPSATPRRSRDPAPPVPPPDEDTSPTLEQMARSGGSTREMALFAVSVCRALGVPSTVIVGSGENGDVRAWVALLEVINGRISFDLESGRADEYKSFVGQTIDPQTYDIISEEELAFLAELQSTTPANRRLSSALTRLATATKVGLTRDPLFGDGEDGNANRFALLLRAVQLSPANRPAWAALRQMAKDTQLTNSNLDDLLPIVTKTIAPKYPLFALDLLRELVSWRGTTEQLAALDAARTMFAGRPELLLRLQLARGDLLAEARRDLEALQAYGLILDRARDAGPLAADAMDRVDRILREQKETKVLLDTYKSVWTHLPAPTLSVRAADTTFYRIGARYADLLEESGESTKATQVRQRLSNLLTDSETRRGPPPNR